MNTSTVYNKLLRSNLPIDFKFTSTQSTRHVQSPTLPGSNKPTTTFTPAIAICEFLHYATAPGGQPYSLVRGLLQHAVRCWPCISWDGSTKSILSESSSKLRSSSQSSPARQKVPQGGAPITKPLHTWIIWNGRKRPIHWHRSRHGLDRCQ